MDNKDLCEHTRIRLIAAALGHQQCTKTAGTEVLIPGTRKRILIGDDAYLARVALPAGEAGIDLDKLRALIADDSYAMTFQTFGQYRTALLKEIDLARRAPAPADERAMLPLPAQHEELRARWKCEDCDGTGEVGEPIGQGYFQPPERARCSNCDGAGQVPIAAYTDDQMRDYALAHQAAPAQPSAAQDAQNSPPRPLRSPDGIMGAAAAVRATERIDAMHKGVVGVFATIKAEHLSASPACAPAAAPTSDQQAGAVARAVMFAAYSRCIDDDRLTPDQIANVLLSAAPAAIEQAGAQPVADWGPVHTVGDMVRNLLTLNQAEPIYTAFHVDYEGERRCRTRPVSISRERVIDGKWVDISRTDVPYANIVWAKQDAPAANQGSLYQAALLAVERMRGCAATYIEDHSKDAYPGQIGLRPQDVANMWAQEIRGIDAKAYLDEAIADLAAAPVTDQAAPRVLYTVGANNCDCHPETCACLPWAIFGRDGKKHSTHFARTTADDIAAALNKSSDQAAPK